MCLMPCPLCAGAFGILQGCQSEDRHVQRMHYGQPLLSAISGSYDVISAKYEEAQYQAGCGSSRPTCRGSGLPSLSYRTMHIQLAC